MTAHSIVAFLCLAKIMSCLIGHTSSSALLADLVPCGGESKVLHFRAEEKMALCCHCTSILCSGPLSLKSQSGQHHNTSDGNSSQVELIVNKAVPEDSGTYICSSAKGQLYRGTVIVIEKPKRPEIMQIMCTQQKSITVRFDRGDSKPLFEDVYTVSIIESLVPGLQQSIVLCNSSVNNVKCVGRVCQCSHQFENVWDQLPANQDVVIAVNVSRTLHQTVETKKVLNLIDYIKPDVVRDVCVGPIGSHEAELYITLPNSLKRLYVFMHTRGHPLWYSAHVYKTQGQPANVTVIMNSINEEVDPYSSTLLSLGFHLKNLTPFTTYIVEFVANGGGGASASSFTSFTTHKTVPQRSPHAEDFTFSRYSDWELEKMDKTGVGSGLSMVALNWQPLPHDVRGGGEVAYFIELSTVYGTRLAEVTTEDSNVIIFNVTAESLIARIWAQNEIGRSLNSIDIFIPAEGKGPKFTSIVEYFDGKREARILANTKHVSVEKFAIHQCLKVQHSQFQALAICQDYPTTWIFEDPVPSGQFDREVNLANPIVNFRVEKEEEIQVEKFQVYEIENYDNYHFKLEILWLSTLEWTFKNDTDVAGEGCSPTELLNVTSIHETQEVNNQRVLRGTEDSWLFLSIMTDGKWSGMGPMTCYYDRAKGDVALTLSMTQPEIGSNSNILLRWKQVCSSEQPQHFLVATYQVFISENEECTNGTKHVQDIVNPYFEPCIIEFKNQNLFACVVGLSSDLPPQMSEPKVMFIGNQKADLSSPISSLPIMAQVSIGGGIILTVLVILFIWKCRQRDRRMKEKFMTSLVHKRPCPAPTERKEEDLENLVTIKSSLVGTDSNSENRPTDDSGCITQAADDIELGTTSTNISVPQLLVDSKTSVTKDSQHDLQLNRSVDDNPDRTSSSSMDRDDDDDDDDDDDGFKEDWSDRTKQNLALADNGLHFQLSSSDEDSSDPNSGCSLLHNTVRI